MFNIVAIIPDMRVLYISFLYILYPEKFTVDYFCNQDMSRYLIYTVHCFYVFVVVCLLHVLCLIDYTTKEDVYFCP